MSKTQPANSPHLRWVGPGEPDDPDEPYYGYRCFGTHVHSRDGHLGPKVSRNVKAQLEALIKQRELKDDKETTRGKSAFEQAALLYSGGARVPVTGSAPMPVREPRRSFCCCADARGSDRRDRQTTYAEAWSKVTTAEQVDKDTAAQLGLSRPLRPSSRQGIHH